MGLVTHVLLPVTLLLRRADAAEVIGAAITARAVGLGHRRIAVWLGLPDGTVRGWLRRMGTRLESVRVHFIVVARPAGVDQAVPKAMGSPRRDLLVALGAARAAVKAWLVAARRVPGFPSPGAPAGSPGADSNTSSP